MIDVEIRELIVHTVRETVQAVMQQNDSVHLQTMLDEMRDEVEASAGAEHPYGADSAAPPGVFEPVFRDGSLHAVGEGMYPVGRRFYSGATVDSSAQISDGCIWLEVTYPSSASASPSAVVKGGSDFPMNAASAVTDSTSWMPLYRIADGAIAVDYRSAMSLTLREL